MLHCLQTFYGCAWFHNGKKPLPGLRFRALVKTMFYPFFGRNTFRRPIFYPSFGQGPFGKPILDTLKTHCLLIFYPCSTRILALFTIFAFFSIFLRFSHFELVLGASPKCCSTRLTVSFLKRFQNCPMLHMCFSTSHLPMERSPAPS